MVIPEEREGRMDDDPNLSRDTTPANATVNTRKGGLQKSPLQQKVRFINESKKEKENISI
jgi:hypothetical protein